MIKPRVARGTETLVYACQGSHYILGRPLMTAHGRCRRVYRVAGIELIATVPTDEAGERVMRFDATRLERCARCARTLGEHAGAAPEGWSGPHLDAHEECAEFTAQRAATAAASACEHRDPRNASE